MKWGIGISLALEAQNKRKFKIRNGQNSRSISKGQTECVKNSKKGKMKNPIFQ